MDLRNVEELCVLADSCFLRPPADKSQRSPKASPASSLFNQKLSQLVKRVEEKAVTKVKCHLCRKFVSASRQDLQKHISKLHHYYRCKSCPTTLRTKVALTKHLKSDHGFDKKNNQAKMGKDYSSVLKGEVLAEILVRCFPNYLTKEQQEPTKVELKPDIPVTEECNEMSSS